MKDNRSPRWPENPGSAATRRSGRLQGGGLGTGAAGRSGRRFTAHLTFEAADLAEARERAVGYAEALGTLRPELLLGAAALSPAGAWHRAGPLFCGAVGPDGERCADVSGHPGFHHAAGPGALGWGDGDR
ncbi:hypothetical protein [Micromonospora cathayae]|uniref:Uncharacterized protein n=1 Tax=Micromonospora cathayae TaxID=3028804 RepID=A0ABY7ZRJ1_9ACTN|nr:hypothetical protein [Micromonospora sp. HUAS 3]WDZ84822.1 hypothetical protein PVK37_31140 [Micromonospora sp. HUAS 3]